MVTVVTSHVTAGPPVLLNDTLPASGSDVVGGQITFAAVFDGSRPLTYQWQFQDPSGNPPVDIPNATNTTLTISSLHLADAGNYFVTASNAWGTLPSTSAFFAVNPLPAATNNIVVTYANQTGLGGSTAFTPNWLIASNSLIAGAAPSSVGPGDFSRSAAGVPAVLTDGTFGQLVQDGNGAPNLVTCGTVAGGAGTSVIYTMPPSNVPGNGVGYDITSIVSYGGWVDSGRDQQRYTVYYATVASPTNFLRLAEVNFNPPNPLPAQSATRASILPAVGTILAKNVAAIKFDFDVLDPSVENGYAGYAELGVFGVLSIRPPTINTVPATCSDVVGSQVAFRANFGSDPAISYQWMKDTGAGGIPILGATNATLILSNLQLSDTAAPGYSLQASNASGVLSSTASPFIVNPLPTPNANGILVAPANQTGIGANFTPTWTLAAGSLIAGLLPSGVGPGIFNLEGCGGLPVLTDGKFGAIGGGINTALASCGPNAGRSITYTLNGPASGFDITNIITYGGWSDGGRDQQAYTVSYSTGADPTIFHTIALANYNPALPGTSGPSADRLTLFSSTAAPIATGAATVRFDFTNPLGENGYSGYAEIAIFGYPIPAAPQPMINSPHLMGGHLILTGSGGTAAGSYSVLTSTNVATPLSGWITNATGFFDGHGVFSNSLSFSALESGRYFLIKTP